MSVYVTSDLHGIELYRLKLMLKRANFGQEDTLYILGDIIDRQNKGGVDVLLWLLEQKNAHLILGNHEAMLLDCKFLYFDNEEADEDALRLYRENGGDYTLDALNELKKNDPKRLTEIFDYLENAPLYKELTVGEKNYLLVHGGLGNFSPQKPLEDYTRDEILWTRPEYDEHYFDDVMTILGHTPTIYYGREHKGKILFRPTWTDIDVGVAYGNTPVMLKLPIGAI